MGISAGGPTAVTMTARHPGLVERLILLSAVGWLPVLMNLGRADQVDVAGLRRLAASINRHFGDGDDTDPGAEAGAVAGAAPLEVIDARTTGSVWLLVDSTPLGSLTRPALSATPRATTWRQGDGCAATRPIEACRLILGFGQAAPC